MTAVLLLVGRSGIPFGLQHGSSHRSASVSIVLFLLFEQSERVLDSSIICGQLVSGQEISLREVKILHICVGEPSSVERLDVVWLHL